MTVRPRHKNVHTLSSVVYSSNGKLLITGEYLVMDGALSLAVPVKMGQDLQVEMAEGPPLIQWESRAKGRIWFTAVYRLPVLDISSTTDRSVALRLQTLLRNACSLRPKALEVNQSVQVITHLDFELSWGLGSSSTLVSNIAYWLDVDPYALFWMTYNGSGYDIACARSTKALLYRVVKQVPGIRTVTFIPPFRDRIFFVYLGKKQDSESGIEHYRRSRLASGQQIGRISEISERLWQVREQEEFDQLLSEHETIISQIIGVRPVKQTLFNDFQGMVKSLGAWGGDFIMTTGRQSPPEIRSYFQRKGLNTMFAFDEMILQ